MRRSMAGFMVGFIFIAGCAKNDTPAPISGVVKTAAGKPVTGVRLILVPETGSTIGTLGFALDNDGRFEGEAKPGKYTYYLAKAAVQMDDEGRPVNATEAKKLKESAQLLKMFPAVYHTSKGAGPERKVEVASGATLALTVSQ